MKLFDNKYGFLFAVFGVVLQFIAFFYAGASILSLISGVSGIFAVVLCAERKMSFWTFAWIQLLTYLVLAFQQKLWGEVGENIFYAITMIGGMFIWNKYKENDQVKSRRLKFGWLMNIYYFGVIGVLGLWFILNYTNDTQPFMDSITTIPAIIAQLLMIMAYREQWYFWLIIDVTSIYMWAIAGDLCMVSQFIFWTINCLYGIKKWNYEIYKV